MEFQLYEDVRVATWRRYTYDVEAETLEEAVKLVKDGDVDCTDMEEFYEDDDYMSPQEVAPRMKSTQLKMMYYCIQIRVNVQV